MNEINLKEQVRAAIQSAWPTFEQSHPHLAAVSDQELLVESASSSISDDPEYRQAMQNAAGAGMAAETVMDIVMKLISAWLTRLV